MTLRAVRAKDFADSGDYMVVDDDQRVVASIYRDPESREWYENPETNRHYTECWLGSTKKEALTTLVSHGLDASSESNRAGPDAKRAAAFEKLVGYVRSIVEPSPLVMTLSPETREKYLAPYRERLVADLNVSDIRKNTGLSAAMIRSLVERNGDDVVRALGVLSVKYVKGSYTQTRKWLGWGMPGADTTPAHVVVKLR